MGINDGFDPERKQLLVFVEKQDRIADEELREERRHSAKRPGPNMAEDMPKIIFAALAESRGSARRVWRCEACCPCAAPGALPCPTARSGLSTSIPSAHWHPIRLQSGGRFCHWRGPRSSAHDVPSRQAARLRPAFQLPALLGGDEEQSLIIGHTIETLRLDCMYHWDRPLVERGAGQHFDHGHQLGVLNVQIGMPFPPVGDGFRHVTRGNSCYGLFTVTVGNAGE